MKKVLPITAAIVCGLVTLADFILSEPHLDTVGAVLVEGVAVLAAFALILGILNLCGLHARRVVPGATGQSRFLSTVLIVALLVTLVIGVVQPASGALTWVFEFIYLPLQSTMTALLAFFLVSAAYRAFRLRSVDAAILLVASLVVLFLQAPFSAAIWAKFALVRDWILYVPVASGIRGILLGTALGTVATSLRILLAVDRPYAGRQEGTP